MCGRFSFSPLAKIIEERFDVKVDTNTYKPRYNCAPSQLLAVVSDSSPAMLSYFRWGLVPFWAKEKSIGDRMINAKAETIMEKPAFKHSFRKRRCLVPCDGFFEWKQDPARTPYRITLVQDQLFALAGIWDIWKDPSGEPVHSFAIITTGCNDMMASIHDRMPVILDKKAEKDWLSSQDLGYLSSLLRPFPSHLMTAYPVSRLVNSPRNDSPEVLQRSAV
jgi:putative SOS response-associated peptidase YedK